VAFDLVAFAFGVLVGAIIVGCVCSYRVGKLMRTSGVRPVYFPLPDPRFPFPGVPREPPRQQ